MGSLMRRQESRRGAMVTDKADREGCSPEMTVLEWADDFKIPAGNSGYGEELKWQAVPDHPGSQAVSSLTQRLCGNQGDPSIGAEERAPSDKCKERGRGQRRWGVGGVHSSDERR